MQLYRTEKVYEPGHIAHELRAPCTRSCDLPCWRLPWRCRRRRRKSKRESSSSAHVTFPAASGSTRQKKAQHDVQGSWVFGYLSGINAENAGVDFLRGKEPDELMAWIDNYCQRNPVHGITQAINELIKELQSGR